MLRSATNGANDRGQAALIDLTFAFADVDGEIPSMLSNSGFKEERRVGKSVDQV